MNQRLLPLMLQYVQRIIVILLVEQKTLYIPLAIINEMALIVTRFYMKEVEEDYFYVLLMFYLSSG